MPITVDGSLTDWSATERINTADTSSGYTLYATEQNSTLVFAIQAPTGVQMVAGTTVYSDTDQNASTGFDVYGGKIGADYSLTLNSNGTETLNAYSATDTTGASPTTVLTLTSAQFAEPTNLNTIEFAIPAASLGNPNAINVAYDIKNTNTATPTVGAIDTYLPISFSDQPYTVDSTAVTQPVHGTERIGIVWSTTSEALSFSSTAYADLIMSVKNQAIQAGIPFDLLSESALTNLSTLLKYSALVFPSFADIQSSQVTAITNTLEQASQAGVGLIAAGNFMTDDQTGAPLPGNSYTSEQLLFGASQSGGAVGTGAVSVTPPTQIRPS